MEKRIHSEPAFWNACCVLNAQTYRTNMLRDGEIHIWVPLAPWNKVPRNIWFSNQVGFQKMDGWNYDEIPVPSIFRPFSNGKTTWFHPKKQDGLEQICLDTVLELLTSQILTTLMVPLTKTWITVPRYHGSVSVHGGLEIPEMGGVNGKNMEKIWKHILQLLVELLSSF